MDSFIHISQKVSVIRNWKASLRVCVHCVYTRVCVSVCVCIVWCVYIHLHAQWWPFHLTSSILGKATSSWQGRGDTSLCTYKQISKSLNDSSRQTRHLCPLSSRERLNFVVFGGRVFWNICCLSGLPPTPPALAWLGFVGSSLRPLSPLTPVGFLCAFVGCLLLCGVPALFHTPVAQGVAVSADCEFIRNGITPQNTQLSHGTPNFLLQLLGFRVQAVKSLFEFVA